MYGIFFPKEKSFFLSDEFFKHSHSKFTKNLNIKSNLNYF